MHTTAGYLLGAAATGKYVFDIHDNDKYFCGGDVGWITGHTYVVYAPLLLGVSTVVFEGTPAYPNFSRYWDIIEKHARHPVLRGPHRPAVAQARRRPPRQERDEAPAHSGLRRRAHRRRGVEVVL